MTLLGRVLIGTAGGLFIGGFLSAITALIVAFAGPVTNISHEVISFGELAGVNMVGGGIGGLLVGLFSFLFRWSVGAALLGAIGVFPWYYGAGFLYYGGQHGPLSGLMVVVPLIGGAFGLYIRHDMLGSNSNNEVTQAP